MSIHIQQFTRTRTILKADKKRYRRHDEKHCRQHEDSHQQQSDARANKCRRAEWEKRYERPLKREREQCIRRHA